jgi:hypothetical protein
VNCIAVLDAYVEEGGAAFLEPQVQVELVIAIDELEQTIMGTFIDEWDVEDALVKFCCNLVFE